jgi:hypothetical protein
MLGWILCSSHRSEIGTLSTKCRRTMAAFWSGVKRRRDFLVMDSGSPLIGAPEESRFDEAEHVGCRRARAKPTSGIGHVQAAEGRAEESCLTQRANEGLGASAPARDRLTLRGGERSGACVKNRTRLERLTMRATCSRARHRQTRSICGLRVARTHVASSRRKPKRLRLGGRRQGTAVRPVIKTNRLWVSPSRRMFRGTLNWQTLHPLQRRPNFPQDQSALPRRIQTDVDASSTTQKSRRRFARDWGDFFIGSAVPFCPPPTRMMN